VTATPVNASEPELPADWVTLVARMPPDVVLLATEFVVEVVLVVDPLPPPLGDVEVDEVVVIVDDDEPPPLGVVDVVYVCGDEVLVTVVVFVYGGLCVVVYVLVVDVLVVDVKV
jgi:hypothetical protein